MSPHLCDPEITCLLTSVILRVMIACEEVKGLFTREVSGSLTLYSFSCDHSFRGSFSTVLRDLESEFWSEVIVGVGVLIHVQGPVPYFITAENSA